MTQDEKIKEVMELVDAYAAKVERSVASGDASAKFLIDETEAHNAIESKLRQLIK